MLWICVLLPELPLEVFTRGRQPGTHGEPMRFAVTSGGHHPRIVIANEAARSCGVAARQLVSAAFALAPDIVLRDRDAAREMHALRGVATWLTQFTPMVSLAAPELAANPGAANSRPEARCELGNCVLADIGGSLRLFGGLRELLQRIEHGVRELGYSVRTACAPTPAAAQFFARAGQCRPVTRRDELARMLAPLPLAHLDADAQAVTLLRTAGVTTFGEACKLPRDALARRVGTAFVTTLDRARGLVPDPQEPFVPPARYHGRLELPVPVSDAGALGFAVNRLVHELSGWLLGRGLGVTELELALEHERYRLPDNTDAAADPRATRVAFAMAAPARDATHVTAVLRERLARVELPAPVESVVLTSRTTAALAGRNLALLPGDESLPQSSRGATVPLIDRFRARLGENAVTCIVALEDHRPERAWEATPTSDECRPRVRPSCALPCGPRPLWLLSEAQPLSATFESRPWVLRDGPERIESGWWDGADIRRDYYVAESPRGEMLWIYRDSVYGADGEWFLHGIFA